MSYPPHIGSGYPPQGGYPPQPQGFDNFLPGQPGQISMPDPCGSLGGAGGYPPQPGAQPSYGLQYPPLSGYPQQPTPTSVYPPLLGSPPQSPTTNIYPPLLLGSPPQSPITSGYPPQPGYPQQPSTPSGYPPEPSFPQQAPAAGGYPGQPQPGYPGQPPAGNYQPCSPGVSAPGYPGGTPAQGGHPGSSGGAQPQLLPKGQGTVRPYPSFNPEEDAKVLRKAMKGIGSDKKVIIEVLSRRSNEQRQKIKNLFKTLYDKDLIKNLKSELTSNMEQTAVALMMTPVEYDADQIYRALSGAGTKEGVLIEIFCTRTNRQIQDIKIFYKTKYGCDLEHHIKNDTSGHFRRVMVALSKGDRLEHEPVDYQKARQDAQGLFDAGEKTLGTDESKLNSILCSQSFEQLRLVFQEYRNIAKKGLDQAIKSEMSGDLEKGMVTLVHVIENIYNYFADRLYHAMKGIGTNDDTLIRVIVTRCEVDMVQIKLEYQRAYGKTLEAAIEGETSGDYKKMLLALVKG